MAKDKELDQLEKKKRELKEELNLLQSQLDNSFDHVREDVSHKLDPVEFIKNHPLPVVGTAVLLGFLTGYSPKSTGRTYSGVFSSLMWEEIKKIATKKALSTATAYIENMLNVEDEKTVDQHIGKNGGKRA